MNKMEPRARFCSCGFEKLRAGLSVYVKHGAMLTTNKKEQHPRTKGPVGKIVSKNGQLLFELNDYGGNLVTI